MNEIEELNKSIEIPEELDLAIALGVERGRKEKAGKTRWLKSKRIKKVAVAAGIVMFTGLALGVSFPAYAEEIPGVGHVIKYISKTFGIDGYDNAEKISYSAYADGYTINVENIYYDRDELTVFYNVKGEKPLDPSKAYWFEGEINYHKGLQYEYGMEKGNLIDDYTFGGMITYYVKPHDGSELPKIFKGDLDIKKIRIGFENTAKEIEIDKKPIKLNLNSENLKIDEYNIEKEIEAYGNTIELLKLYKYPNKITIYYKFNINNENKELRYYLWDTKKGILEYISGNQYKDNVSFRQYGLPSKDGEVFIIPIISKTGIPRADVQIDMQLLGKGKKYDFGNRGTVEIEDIKQGENETFITVKTTGEQSVFKLDIFDEVTGKRYKPNYEVEKEIQGLLEQRVKYAFPKLDLNKKYYIEVINRKDDYTILKDQIIKLDIKQ